MSKYILLSLILISITVNATLYSSHQIQEILQNETVGESKVKFIQGFFVSKQPMLYIDDYIRTNEKKIEPIYMENNLYGLLNEISTHSKQAFMQEYLDYMKSYEIQSYKTHEESLVQIPIYNFKSRIKGIENIWLSADSFSFYLSSFSSNPVDTLIKLEKSLPYLKAPQWLGLKNCIINLSFETQKTITNYFLNSPDNITALAKFVVHFALQTKNKKLVQLALKSVDKSSSEYLLRKLYLYFEDEFVVEKLIYHAQNNRSPNFSISLMTQYIDKYKQINSFLLDSITDEELTNTSAFALSKTNDLITLKKLQALYINADSIKIRGQIKLSIRLNKNTAATIMYQELMEK